jgi:hypothetical protein
MFSQRELRASVGLSGDQRLPTIISLYFVVLFVSAFMASILSLVLMVGNSTASPMSSDWVRIAILLFTMSATISAATSYQIGDFVGSVREKATPIVFLSAWLSLLVAASAAVSDKLGTSVILIFVLLVGAGLFTVLKRLG